MSLILNEGSLVGTMSKATNQTGEGAPMAGDKLVLTDRVTAKKYVLYVSDGKLMMEESEA